jgi:hypothetical protein
MKGAKLEFLDIDLNTWSLIVFFSQTILMISIFILLATVSTASFVFMTFFWFLAQIIFLFYGISTDQIGFVFLFLFNIIITVIGIFVNLDKSAEWEDDDE